MGRNFWVANLLEAGERLAFYGARAVLPLYMVGSSGSALGLSYSQKGLIYMLWAILQCLVPMVSGGFTDAYGYKVSLYAAYALNIAGYLIMAQAAGFWGMLAAASLVGLGSALFKPPAQGMVARSLDEGNSGLGFGLYYWAVNIGGFLGPLAAAAVRGDTAHPTWPFVFYGAALVTAWNFIPTAFAFQEPPRPASEDRLQGGVGRPGPAQVLADTMRTLWRDKAMLYFLLAISGFWFMFLQLWDLLPNFIDEWVDTRGVGAMLVSVLGPRAWGFVSAAGSAKPEILINIDALAIIVLVAPLSWLFGRFSMLTVMVLGMALSLAGFVGAGMTSSGGICAAFIFLFAVGEIIFSPKFYEYVGMSAPPDKKAVYMGFSNIPFALGWAAGNGISGPLYDRLASQAALAREFLVAHAGLSPAAAARIPGGRLLAEVARWIGPGATTQDAVGLLWREFHPWKIWVILGAVGLLSVLGVWLLSLSAAPAPSAAVEEGSP